jgi:transcriptional regulator with XRE-family HTH domain
MCEASHTLKIFPPAGTTGARARRRRAAGATLAELARSYDVSRSTISRLTQ